MSFLLSSTGSLHALKLLLACYASPTRHSCIIVLLSSTSCNNTPRSRSLLFRSMAFDSPKPSSRDPFVHALRLPPFLFLSFRIKLSVGVKSDQLKD